MPTPSSVPPSQSYLMPSGYHASDCGYCKGEASSRPKSSGSYHMRARTLAPEHYQELMDRGWRRSGDSVYLPDALRSCCPHYTIRLPASDFKATRDQRQVLNRWNRWVLGDEYAKQASTKYPVSKEEKKRQNNSFDLLSAVHESEVTRLKPEIKPEHTFEVRLESDDFTKAKFALFSNYQRHVHGQNNMDISKEGFTRFLCSSPIPRGVDSDGKMIGSYHQCYRLDGRLIAMAVLDLLPHAVSAVYFVYHSDFEKWSLGKLSALREAALALEAGYQYYYMGYYIHDCPKMRYKAHYKPQYVLDFESLQWNPLDDEMLSLMDTQKYASISRERVRKALQDTISADEKKPNAVLGDKNGIVKQLPVTKILCRTPQETARSRLSLLKLRMPGVLTLQQLRNQINIAAVQVQIGKQPIFPVENAMAWPGGSELDKESLQGFIAEIAAVVGPTIAKEAVIYFAHSH